MGVEQHSYGAVLGGLITRRRFVQLFSAAGFAVSVTQLVAALSGFLMAGGIYSMASQKTTCIGAACYEVFTCDGFREGTQHLREPFLQVFAAVVFFLGMIGATYGSQWQLKYTGRGVTILGIAYIGTLVFDILYTKTCDAYSLNIIEFVLTPASRIPPSPLTGAAKEQLSKLTVFPISVVASLTQDFNVLTWYSFVAGAVGLVFLYVGTETKFLSDLVGRGPLGLGVNYGLNQWDEIINHDAIRIVKEQRQKSQFIEDAKLPLPFSVPLEEGNGYEVAPRGSPYDSTSYGGIEEDQTTAARYTSVPHLRMDRGVASEQPRDGYVSSYVPKGGGLTEISD